MQNDATITMPPDFVTILLGHADPQDLAACPPVVQSRLAETAWRHLAAVRPPGTADIRFVDHDIDNATPPRQITVLQVVNDNMPFLLDSTLAEIAEQGYEPTLVAHPILAVSRDKTGGFLHFGDTTGSRRESLLHIHLPRIDDPAARARLTAGLQRVYADVATSVADWVAMREMHSA